MAIAGIRYIFSQNRDTHQRYLFAVLAARRQQACFRGSWEWRRRRTVQVSEWPVHRCYGAELLSTHEETVGLHWTEHWIASKCSSWLFSQGEGEFSLLCDLSLAVNSLRWLLLLLHGLNTRYFIRCKWRIASVEESRVTAGRHNYIEHI